MRLGPGPFWRDWCAAAAAQQACLHLAHIKRRLLNSPAPFTVAVPHAICPACSAFGTALFHEPIVSAGSDGLVIVRDITFAALSEHTLLPFHGRCHIAYVPRHGVVLGLSKLARVTKCLAARLQTQQAFTERLIAAVAEEVRFSLLVVCVGWT